MEIAKHCNATNERWNSERVCVSLFVRLRLCARLPNSKFKVINWKLYLSYRDGRTNEQTNKLASNQAKQSKATKPVYRQIDRMSAKQQHTSTKTMQRANIYIYMCVCVMPRIEIWYTWIKKNKTQDMLCSSIQHSNAYLCKLIVFEYALNKIDVLFMYCTDQSTNRFNEVKS